MTITITITITMTMTTRGLPSPFRSRAHRSGMPTDMASARRRFNYYLVLLCVGQFSNKLYKRWGKAFVMGAKEAARSRRLRLALCGKACSLMPPKHGASGSLTHVDVNAAEALRHSGRLHASSNGDPSAPQVTTSASTLGGKDPSRAPWNMDASGSGSAKSVAGSGAGSSRHEDRKRSRGRHLSVSGVTWAKSLYSKNGGRRETVLGQPHERNASENDGTALSGTTGVHDKVHEVPSERTPPYTGDAIHTNDKTYERLRGRAGGRPGTGAPRGDAPGHDGGRQAAKASDKGRRRLRVRWRRVFVVLLVLITLVLSATWGMLRLLRG